MFAARSPGQVCYQRKVSRKNARQSQVPDGYLTVLCGMHKTIVRNQV
jgi:hypothetical protein